MILLLCTRCRDTVAPREEVERCSCGRVIGQLQDGIILHSIGAVPIGITDSSIKLAITNRPTEGLGYRLEAVLLPRNTPFLSVAFQHEALSSHLKKEDEDVSRSESNPA